MASQASDSDGPSDAAPEPRECMACRGSGKVISNLGGSPSTVTCPWCEGASVRLPDVDAQARWPREEPPGEPDADAAARADVLDTDDAAPADSAAPLA